MKIFERYKKLIKPHMFSAMYEWYKQGGGSYEDENNIKLAGVFTNDDLEIIALMNQGGQLDNLTKEENKVTKRLIEVFGEVCNAPLYRGVSEKEKSSILNAKTTVLARPMSFSEKKEIAKDFGEYVLTVKKSSQKIFDLSSFQINLQLSLAKFLEESEGKEAAEDSLEQVDFEMMVDENEFEWLVPKDTKFKVIDREKLMFEI